ncbi:N-acetylmuramoyl-L-alanine amidase [Synergistaceae bacterium OttesenSCG-928-D05]|nr:N-acetylmuramoyl-L-alanine amidase [Synergistaceae bacterium OttesenSCG-928-D05]
MFLQVSKKIIGCWLVLLLFLAVTASAASADTMALWYGDIKKGDVTIRKNSMGGFDAAAEEVVSALGLVPSAVQNGLVVVMSGNKIEFWNNASVIRVSNNIVPLFEPIMLENNHWWVDGKSLASAFDQFFSSIGRKTGLQWKASDGTAAVTPAPAAKPAAAKPEAAKPADTKPAAKPAETKAPEVKPAATKPAAEPKPAAAPAPIVIPNTNRKPIVVIDAGHGGHDPGATANGLREKDINLKATLELGKILAGYGVDVRYTRRTDVYLKLAERTQIANNHKADVFISMHCNAVPKGRKAAGLEYYIMALPSDKDAMQLAVTENRELASGGSSAEATAQSDKKTQLLLKILGDMQQNDKINESTALCEVLHRNAKASGLPMRKVGQAPFFVLRGAAMPAVLVEMGFLTDAAEAKKLNTQSYREKLCKSIAAGVVQYIREHPVNVQ